MPPSNEPENTTPGIVVIAADCAALKIPAIEQPLCPNPPVSAALGVDGLVNAQDAPRVLYEPVDVYRGELIDTMPWQRALAYSVLRQQPMRVTGDIASEGVNLHRQCHDLFHVDVPWSLITIEQRNGRIDRYGQLHPPQTRALLHVPSDARLSGDLGVMAKLLAKDTLYARTECVAAAAFLFHAPRCDSVVAAVLAQLPSDAALP